MVVTPIKLNSYTSTTKRGKTITRYSAVIQKSTIPANPNINAGITPKGTLYYRALLPDKSWGSLYLKKKNGDEVIIDSCKIGEDIQTKAEVRNSDGIIKSDTRIQKFAKGTESVKIISVEQNVGRRSSVYIQKNAKLVLNDLQKQADKLTPTKPKFGIFSKLFKLIK